MALRSRLNIDKEYAADKSGRESMFDLFHSELFPDCTIKCGNRVWRLHRGILASRSSYFAATFSGPFTEGQTNITTLHNDNPTAVNILLLHFYRPFMTSDELADYTEDYESFDGFQTIIELVQVADKYGAIGLIPICELTLEDLFGRRVFSHFNHGEDCVQLSRMFLSTIFNNEVFNGMQGVKRGAARYVAEAYKFCGTRRGELNELLGESSELRMMVLDALSAEAAWSR